MIDSRATPDPPRILLLVPGFPENERDSTCLPALQSFVEALSRPASGRPPEVIAFQYPYHRRSYTWRGVRVHALGGGNSAFKKPLMWLRAILMARRIAADSPIGTTGVVHSFWMGECALIGAILARFLAWKHVVSIGGQEIRRPTAYSRLLRRESFVLTAGSDYAAEIARHRAGWAVDFVIPLGLDIARVDAVASVPNRDIDVLAVGSMTPVKRFADVVHVAARLAEVHTELRVVIVGDGACRPAIEEQVATSGLAGNVEMTGGRPRGEVLRLMRRSKILLHPSGYESQGYVFLEALASGLHVVCRDVGFAGGSSKVLLCRNVGEMAAAVSRILESRSNYEPVKVPSAEETAALFRELYSELIYFNDFGGTNHRSTP